MHTSEASNHGPRSGSGSQLQPRFDSLGRKVPIWDAVEIETRQNVEKQTSWKSWMSKSSSTSTLKEGIQYGTESQRQPSTWTSWIPFALRGKPRSISKDLHPSSPYVSLPSNSFDQPTSWKPINLRLPVLGSIFVFTLGMIAVLEVLSHLSRGKDNENGGGLAFAPTVDELSNVAIAGYLYLPTVIAVLYSMMWSWIDLDVKRLEPWFQLSKPQGAVAEESLLLQYPFDFLAFVPLRAARRRHWAVFIAGSTMIFITWAIVPLQSAIFTTGTVLRSNVTPMAITHALMPSEDQTTKLDSHFMNTAYGVSWLGQKLPPYTTKEYALLPFRPQDLNVSISQSETWTGATQLYYTNLTCTPAPTVVSEQQSNSWTFDDGNGCRLQSTSVPGAMANNSDYMVLYIQYWDDANVDRALANPNCTLENKHKFLALWGQKAERILNGFESPYFTNITALFCQPTYHVRPVTATVNATSLAVLSVDFNATEPAAVLTEDSFNITNFEYLIGTGVRPDSFTQTGNIADISRLQHYPRLLNYSIVYPPSQMVSYGVAASTVSPAGLQDPAQLRNAFHKAHQLLFATAVNQLAAVLNITDTRHTALKVESEGVRRDRPQGIIFVRSFAIIVESCLGVVALLACILWAYYYNRNSNMVSDPGSICDVMRLVQSSKQLLHDFHDNGTVSTEVLEERLRGHKFQLVVESRNGFSGMQLRALGGDGIDCDLDIKRSKTEIDCPEQHKAVRPFELRYITGAMILAVVAAAMVTVAFFFVRVRQYNGVERPTNNAVVLTILINIIPTAFATLIEPLWVLLNRLLCILQPFNDLRNGDAAPRSTVKARYTSVPPQLTFWSAIRSKHFLLAAVCAVALSTNILAVSLSALVTESTTTVLLPGSTNALYLSHINGTPDFQQSTAAGYSLTYLDHYYAAIANLSGEAQLPPWVDNKFFYSPFRLPPIAENAKAETEVMSYSTQTRGYGVDVACSALLSEGEGDTINFFPAVNGSSIEFSVSHLLSDGRNVTCTSWNNGNQSTINAQPQSWTGGLSAMEIVAPMALGNETFDTPDDDGYCNSLWVLGWVRLGLAASAITAQASNATDGRYFEPRFMQCRPHFQTAMFNVSVDKTGRVLTSNKTTDFETEFEFLGGADAVERLMWQTTLLASPYQRVNDFWRNTTLASDWFNAALALMLNNTRLVDPSLPAPDIEELAPSVADLYRRLSAMILSFDTKLFTPATEDDTLPLTTQVTQTRIFMEPIMFYITMSLLALQLLTLVAYYGWRPRRFLPRLPLTIASVIAYVAASHAVKDVGAMDRDRNIRYAYGRFRGVDGLTHVGIELAPLVVPLKSRNPAARKRKLWEIMRRKTDPVEPRTWI